MLATDMGVSCHTGQGGGSPCDEQTRAGSTQLGNAWEHFELLGSKARVTLPSLMVPGVKPSHAAHRRTGDSGCLSSYILQITPQSLCNPQLSFWTRRSCYSLWPQMVITTVAADLDFTLELFGGRVGISSNVEYHSWSWENPISSWSRYREDCKVDQLPTHSVA